MKRQIALLTACVLLLPLAINAQSEEGYDSRSYARLSYVSGEVNVQRAGDMGYEAGTVNLALISGDKLAVQEGRAEVGFGRQNYLRLDRLGQVELANLPGESSGSYKIHLLDGRLYLRVSSLDQEKEFEVHTPDASFYILERGLYRLDVLGKGETRLLVVEGSAEAAGETGSLQLRSGQSVVAKNGNLMSGPDDLYAQADDFSRWNQSRDSLLASRPSSSFLPQELNEYGAELDDYGDWHYEGDYGYVWVPEVDYYRDWRPYYYGHWVWYPIIGWTWIADEPWGWCVTHYGRWHWGLDLGWYWIPTRSWGPAWVNWYWDNDYLGWCPLNYWNRPVVVMNNVFYRDYGYSDYSVHNRALTVVSRNQLQARRVSDVALRGTALERIGRVNLSRRQPGITPAVSRSGRMFDQARRTFEQSGVRPVNRTYSRDFSGRTGRLSNSLQERNPWPSPSSGRSAGDRGTSLSRRLSNFDRAGGSTPQSSVSARRIREFSSNRSGLTPLQNRSSSSSSRSLTWRESRRTTSGLSAPSQVREFSSRSSSGGQVSPRSFSTGRVSNWSSNRNVGLNSNRGPVQSREFSSRLSSSGRTASSSTQRNFSSSDRSPAWSSRLPSRSSASPTYRSTPNSYFRSNRSESTVSRSRSWSSPSPMNRSSNFFSRESVPSTRSFSSPSRSYSSPSPSFSSSGRSTSSPRRDFSFSSPGRSSSRPSYSSPSHSSAPSPSSNSSSGHSFSSRSSNSSSSSSGSHIRRRDR